MGSDWVGSILLKVVDVCQDELYNIGRSDSDMREIRRQRLISRAKEVDICGFFGRVFKKHNRYRGQSHWKTCRLYLDPDLFHLPPSGVRVEESPQWAAVKDHIKLMAMKRGNPVVCNGGNKGCKVFRCASCYRKRGGSEIC